MSLPFPNTNTGPTSVVGDDAAAAAALDAPLIALTNRCHGDLRQLLHAFFSFLHRRTDFYVIPHDDNEEGEPLTMGFRQGDAEKMLLAAFRQFPLRRMPPRQRESGANKAASADPVALKEGPSASLKPNKAESKLTDVAAKKDKATTTTPTTSTSMTTTTPTRSSPPSAAAATKQTTATREEMPIHWTKEGKQIPVGNGGTTERYTWTQTLDEATVLLAVPEGTRGKDLKVQFQNAFLSVRTKQPLPGESEPLVLLEGALAGKIRTDESTWSLDEGGVLILILEKLQKSWWETVLEGDDKIDTSLVDSRRHIQDYDESTQSAIRKIMFDQRQERLGLPTSDEILGKKQKKKPEEEEVLSCLPPGVEYIDKAKLDEHDKGAK